MRGDRVHVPIGVGVVGGVLAGQRLHLNSRSPPAIGVLAARLSAVGIALREPEAFAERAGVRRRVVRVAHEGADGVIILPDWVFGHWPARLVPQLQPHVQHVRTAPRGQRRVAVAEQNFLVQIRKILLVVAEPHVHRERAVFAVVDVGELECVLLQRGCGAARDHRAEALVRLPVGLIVGDILNRRLVQHLAVEAPGYCLLQIEARPIVERVVRDEVSAERGRRGEDLAGDRGRAGGEQERGEAHTFHEAAEQCGERQAQHRQ